tara:strand:+ start:1078 stop:1500 length:423 start_codon:yes stop_codon:yes gene_type:complete
MTQRHVPPPIRVVVAEDDPAVLELVRVRLGLAGYAVSHARNGLAAVELIRSVQPEVVVLDINMPDLDGFGVLTAMARLRLPRPPAVLMLSARCAGEDIQRCIALGAKDYLAKPFADKDLLARMARLIRRPPSGGPQTLAA